MKRIVSLSRIVERMTGEGGTLGCPSGGSSRKPPKTGPAP